MTTEDNLLEYMYEREIERVVNLRERIVADHFASVDPKLKERMRQETSKLYEAARTARLNN